MKSQNLFITIFLSLLATVTFGIIDGLSFLFIEESLTNFWKKYSIFNDNTIPLINGGISSSIAIFATTLVYILLEKYFPIISHPLLDAFGIIIGTIIVILGFTIYSNTRFIKLLSF